MPGALSAGLRHAVPYPPASAQDAGIVVALRDRSLNMRAAVSARQEPMLPPPVGRNHLQPRLRRPISEF